MVLCVEPQMVVAQHVRPGPCGDVSDLQPLPARDVLSDVLLRVMGGENYHPIEYQLFYVDLRDDARRRVAVFLGH